MFPTLTNLASDDQAAARKAAHIKKKSRLARKKAREARGKVSVSICKPLGTKVTITIEDAKPITPAPEEVISDVKREVLRFEEDPYAMNYERPETPWASLARSGCRRIW